MSESAEALANFAARRNISIEVTNVTQRYCLADPIVHLESGGCHVPPAPVVITGTSDLSNFTKSPSKTTGTVGVMSYDVLDRDTGFVERVVMMFSVPFDRNMYENWFALGVYNDSKVPDEKLYKEMYYNKEQVGFVRAKCNGSCITFEGKNVDVMATMSPLGRAIMKIEVWDKLFRHG